MENAGKFIEDESLRAQIKGCGIGTSATRAGILEKLVKEDFLSLNKKTQTLTPTEKGEIVWEVVRQTIPGLLSPKMTASWEKGLSSIENGEVSPKEFKATLVKYVTNYVNTIKQGDSSEVIIDQMVLNPAISLNTKPQNINELVQVSESQTGVMCPVCGQPVLRKKMGNKEWFSCSNYTKNKSGCFFALSTFGITDQNLREAINGETNELNLRSSAGKEFTCILKVGIDNTSRKSSWIFTSDGEESSYVCPKCHKNLLENEERLFCDCGFTIKKEFSGKKLDTTDLLNLLKNKTTGIIDGFYSTKKHKSFKAELVITKDYKVEFKFEKKKGRK